MAALFPLPEYSELKIKLFGFNTKTNILSDKLALSGKMLVLVYHMIGHGICLSDLYFDLIA